MLKIDLIEICHFIPSYKPGMKWQDAVNNFKSVSYM